MKKPVYSLIVALVAASSGATEYVFTNKVDNSIATSGNWTSGQPADSESTAIVNMVGLADGTTISFGEGAYVWQALWAGSGNQKGTGASNKSWTLSGGQLNLTDGFQLDEGTLHLQTQLAGDALYYARGTKIRLESEQTNDLKLGSYNGRLTLAAKVSEGTELHADQNGTLEIAVDQAVKSLSGIAEAARVELAAGKTLTVNGGADATEFKGSLIGSGALVKKGESDLVFSGDHTTNHPFAGSVDVREGALAVKRVRKFVHQIEPTLYWSFDNPENPGVADVGSYGFKPYTWNSKDESNGRVESSVNLSGDGSRALGVHPDGTVMMSLGNRKVMPQENNPFSVLCWFRVDSTTTGEIQVYGWGSRLNTAGSACCLRVPAAGGVAIHHTYQDSAVLLTVNEAKSSLPSHEAVRLSRNG